MDWIKPESLQTVAGAAFVVTLLVAVLKAIFPAITGRITQYCALIMSLAISCAIGTWTSPMAVLLTVINGIVIYAASMGIDQMVNYKKG